MVPVLLLGSPFFSFENLVSVLGASAVILVVALWQWLQMKGGPAYLAGAFDARPVPGDTSDPALMGLRRITEKLARKTGIPTPRVHVMPDEPRIKAFAAGLTIEDAIVGVSQGAIQKLDESDLEALAGRLPSQPAIISGEGTDYPYRIRVDRDELALVVAQLVREIDYVNFKDAVRERQGAKRAKAYGRVWGELRALEQ